MSIKILTLSPIFPTPHHHRHVTITNFSRWNNANAEPFNRRLRTQKLIEDDLRRARRFDSADRIAESHSDASASPFRSVGTPSDPSRRSIPGRKSKYSKIGNYPSGSSTFRPQFREREVRVGVGDDDVVMKASEYSGNVNNPSGNSTFGDDDVPGEVREGGADVAMEAFRYSEDSVFRDSGNGVAVDWDGNSGNEEFSSLSVGRFDGSVEEREEGGDADVAVKVSKYSENSRFRRFKGSDGEIKQEWDGDVAVKGSKNSGNVKTLHPASRRFRDKEGREGGADVAVKAYKNYGDEKPSHPAFRRFKDSVRDARMTVKSSKYSGNDKDSSVAEEGVRVCEDGVSYVVGGAPFEFMYSYTETPKVKPVRLREPPVAPFGPTTMARPWTGRKPLAKKKLPEFDSFKLPPPHKKGVKPVQSPGPFLPGSGPKYVHSREEILGEPLTKAEIEEVVNGCRKSRRQMHMGRDGLTHNMLENIHAHWKRRRVCKIKCLGVCTVDMNNVRQQLEDKTGGKVIYRSGGVIYLFRGRNYNYMTRPRYPLMLWKPITPVYPRLVQRVPDGLTLEEASEMRKKGRSLIPIYKLGKNGVYFNLVRDVREAFEACDLVRINCQGMSSSDYHKIGAKLKDLVPCVLISFEREHILMWRGKEWTSSLPELGETPKIENSEYDVTLSSTSDSEDEGISTSFSSDSEDEGISTSFSSDSEDEGISTSITEKDCSTSSRVSDSFLRTDGINGNEILNTVDDYTRDNIKLSSLWAKGVQSLLKEAMDNGAAIILDNSSLDSDTVFQTALGLAKSAPPGPVFKDRRRKVVVQKPEKPKTEDSKVEEVLMIQDNNRGSAKKSSYKREIVMEGVEAEYIDVVPQGSLRVDELAKLLA